MRDGVRRATMAAGLVVGLGLVTGCSVTGEVWLGSDDVRVDLQLSHSADGGPQPCRDDSFTTVDLERSAIDAPPGRLACRITGTVSLQDPHANWFFSSFGDHVDPVPGIDAALDLTVHAPGEVIALGGGGIIDGTTVRWTDVATVQPHGLALTARTRPGLPPWLAPASGGLLAGLLGVTAVPWLGRLSRAKVDADPEVDAHLVEGAAVPPPLPEPEREPELPPEDPEVWSRP